MKIKRKAVTNLLGFVAALIFTWKYFLLIQMKRMKIQIYLKANCVTYSVMNPGIPKIAVKIIVNAFIPTVSPKPTNPIRLLASIIQKPAAAAFANIFSSLKSTL
jgi:hypothetical protein